jgi:hypothetical protein
MENQVGYIVLLIIFGIIGALATWYGLRTIKKNQEATQWPTVMGTITGSELESYISTDSDGDQTTMYSPLITYEYEVEGDVYTSTRVKVMAPSSSNIASMQRKKLEPYPVGAAVEVHYNPFSPEDALLEISTSKINLPLIIGIVSDLVALYAALQMILSL